MADVTLPEITIEGRPGNPPENASDWFCDGFMFGWNNPGVAPSPPAPLRDDLLAAYYQGVQAGRDALEGVQALADPGPEVVPDLGGEPYEELERRWREAWSEFLNHREDPHIEAKPTELPKIPGIEFAP